MSTQKNHAAARTCRPVLQAEAFLRAWLIFALLVAVVVIFGAVTAPAHAEVKSVVPAHGLVVPTVGSANNTAV